MPSSSPPAPQSNPLVPTTRQQRFITDNVAKDNSIMYNGDIIIDKATNEFNYNVTVNNTLVLCMVLASKKKPTVDEVLGSSRGNTNYNTMTNPSREPSVQSSPSYIPRRPLVQPQGPRKGKAQPPSILITLCGAAANAIILPEVEGNWISSRIVKKMGAQISSRIVKKTEAQRRTKSDSNTRVASYNKNDKSTGEYLELSCHRDKSRPSCRHRFYITEAKRFDVVLGRDLDGLEKR